MNNETHRMDTYSAMENPPQNVQQWAAAGFFFTNCGLQCYWCMKRVTSVSDSEDPWQIHNANCPFVQNPGVSGNIPSGETIDYQDEAVRLNTFQNWPLTFLSPAQLARCGFYFLHRSDQVKCAFCSGVVGQWEATDDPVKEHLRFFPTCPKARAIAAESATIVVPASLPKAMQFVTLEARVASFEAWQSSGVQIPERLAEAGFYYLGVGDEVRCFHCDGGLRNWLESDEPFEEHAKWFPKCQFLHLAKGLGFVMSVQREKKGENKETIQQVKRPVLTLEEAMSSEPVVTCLQMGLGIGRIRTLVKRKLETTGASYTTPQALAEAVLDDQLENECDDEDNQPIREAVASYLWGTIRSNVPSTSSEPLTVGRVEVRDQSEEVADIVERVKISGLANRDTKDLEEENKRLRDARECKICMSNEIEVVFIPCGHLVTCVQCAVACVQCPICRSGIDGQVRTFLA